MARTAPIKIEALAAPAVCLRRVLQYSSRLQKEKLVKSVVYKCKFRRPHTATTGILNTTAVCSAYIHPPAMSSVSIKNNNRTLQNTTKRFAVVMLAAVVVAAVGVAVVKNPFRDLVCVGSKIHLSCPESFFNRVFFKCFHVRVFVKVGFWPWVFDRFCRR